jgi:hypothetical protein
MSIWLEVMLYCTQMNEHVGTLNNLECASGATTSHGFKTKVECEKESELNHYGKAKCIEIKL